MNGDPPERDIYERLNQLSSDQKLLFLKIDSLKTAVDTLMQSRQFSWPAMLSAGMALVVFGGVVWGAVQMSIRLSVEPIRQSVALHDQVREEMRDDSRENYRRIGILETELSGFMQSTLAKEIEVEQQFKGVGQVVNMHRLEQLRAICRMDPKECTQLQYWPEIGRLVSNGSKKE